MTRLVTDWKGKQSITKDEALEQPEIGDAEIKQMLNDIEYYQKRVEELEQLLQDYVLICIRCGDDLGIVMDDM